MRIHIILIAQFYTFSNNIVRLLGSFPLFVIDQKNRKTRIILPNPVS
jgi:hypothetical protein